MKIFVIIYLLIEIFTIYGSKRKEEIWEERQF